VRWQGKRKSDNVVDRRGISGRGLAVGGGLGGLVIVVLYFLLGGNPSEITQSLQTDGTLSPAAAGQPLSEKEKEMGDFVSVVLDAFTHGTSAQRIRWFKKGLETGDLREGDTFNARNL